MIRIIGLLPRTFHCPQCRERGIRPPMNEEVLEDISLLPEKTRVGIECIPSPAKEVDREYDHFWRQYAEFCNQRNLKRSLQK